MPCNHPELALRKLQGLKQGGRLINDFLMTFDNLKIKANLSNDFALHILLQNVSAPVLEKTILMHGEPVSYSHLQGSLREVG